MDWPSAAVCVYLEIRCTSWEACIIWEGWQPYMTTLIFLELALESIILLQTRVNAIGEERRVPVSIDPA